MTRSKVLGTGSFAPEKVLTNQDLEKMVDTSDEWITERTGIKERRIADDGTATSDLAVEAARRALEASCTDPKDIDLILVATATPDMIFPATGCIVQDKLGARKAAAFDISSACAGFTFALANADAFIRAGIYRRVLVIGAETISKITDWTDRNTCVLFGDGAGAAVMGPTQDGSGVLSTHLHTDGSMADLICIPGGGSQIPASQSSVENRLHFIKMKGNETFKVAVRTLGDAVIETLEHNGIKVSDLDLLVPHQANLRIIKATAKRLGVPLKKVVITVQKYGNTSAASVPMALDEAVRDGRVMPGKLVMLESFGGGLSWASALIRW